MKRFNHRMFSFTKIFTLKLLYLLNYKILIIQFHNFFMQEFFQKIIKYNQ